MTERTIVDAAARLRREHEPHLIATVACVRGSAYRRPGARMLITRFRWVAGSVSGGCLEGDIANKGWWRTRDGEPNLVTYDSRVVDGADDEDIRAAFGLGCDGVVEVLLERTGVMGRIDALEVAQRCLRQQKRGAVATVFRGPARIGTRAALVGDQIEAEDMPADLRALLEDDLRAAMATGRTTNVSHGELDVLIEAILPPPRLFVIGTGHDAVPVAALGKQLGWDVVVCARQQKFTVRDRFATVDEVLVGTDAEICARIDESDRALAIVMSHNYERDRDMLGALMNSQAQYIGMLGPKARTNRMFDELGCAPDDRVHAPVGLELGAETPVEIALAIVAEAQAVLTSTSATSLRDRRVPIHTEVRAEPVLVAV